MKAHIRYNFVIILMMGLIHLGGCDYSKKIVEEREEPLFQEGQLCLQENRNEEAFDLFNRLLEKRKGACPETHFELGQLYLRIKKDPIFAIYHFRCYLEKSPEGKLARVVVDLIDTAKKEFIRTLPLNDRYTENKEHLDLLDILKQVRAENDRLKVALAQARLSNTLATHTTNNVVTPVVPMVAQQGSLYTVQDGDSLSKISLKMYGNAGKWKRIYDANRDVLPSANSVRVGMKLRIPANTPKE